MSAFFHSAKHFGHEQVVFFYDKETGLKAIIAIHDTTLGPALGGTRLLPYATEDEALEDVLRLSRGMTYKAACAGLSLGGGKAVIIADPNQKSEVFFRAYGRFVESLGGRYITAEDMNTNVRDMDFIRMETRYVTGVSPEYGGSGDPSGLTALGTFHGIRAAVQYRLGRTHCDGLRIAVQGIGSVGYQLCKMLKEDGAQLYVQDVNAKRTLDASKDFGATVVTEAELYDLDVDVYAPCARGATLNDDTLSRLKAKIVAGCANNQLEDENKHGAMIKERKILYAPDYVINAGGLINVASELSSHNEARVNRDVAHIAQTLLTIFADADRLGITTQEAANHYAEGRIKKVQNLKNLNTYKTSVYAQLKKS